MMSKTCFRSILFFIAVTCALATENYMDYGGLSELSGHLFDILWSWGNILLEDGEKAPSENIHELYRLLLQRNALENNGFNGIPLEHLMIRKSQRSPSLRLRFGRSDPHLSMGVLSRPMGAVAAGFDDNN